MSPYLAEHLAIAGAMQRRDPDAAEAAAREHIRQSRKRRLRMFIFDEEGR